MIRPGDTLSVQRRSTVLEERNERGFRSGGCYRGSSRAHPDDLPHSLTVCFRSFRFCFKGVSVFQLLQFLHTQRGDQIFRLFFLRLWRLAAPVCTFCYTLGLHLHFRPAHLPFAPCTTHLLMNIIFHLPTLLSAIYLLSIATTIVIHTPSFLRCRTLLMCISYVPSYNVYNYVKVSMEGGISRVPPSRASGPIPRNKS